MQNKKEKNDLYEYYNYLATTPPYSSILSNTKKKINFFKKNSPNHIFALFCMKVHEAKKYDLMFNFEKNHLGEKTLLS